MKKFVRIIAVFAISVFIISGCGHQNREKRLAKIDTLSAVLTKVDSMLTFDLKYDSIMLNFNELKKNQELLSPFILKFSQKEKSDFNQYISSEKQFKNAIAAYEKYKSELDYSRKQLADLKSDFENRSIKKDKFEEYYSIENKAVYVLLNSVKTEVFKTQKHFGKFNYFQPIIEKLLQEKRQMKGAIHKTKSP